MGGKNARENIVEYFVTFRVHFFFVGILVNSDLFGRGKFNRCDG